MDEEIAPLGDIIQVRHQESRHLTVQREVSDPG